MRLIFDSGEVVGTKMSASLRGVVAAWATASPWFPPEAATTRSASGRAVRNEKAPLTLNAPVFWSCSSFRKRFGSTSSTGVFRMWGRIRSAAASMSARDTSIGAKLVPGQAKFGAPRWPLLRVSGTAAVSAREAGDRHTLESDGRAGAGDRDAAGRGPDHGLHRCGYLDRVGHPRLPRAEWPVEQARPRRLHHRPLRQKPRHQRAQVAHARRRQTA